MDVPLTLNDLPRERVDMVNRLANACKDLHHEDCCSRTSVLRWLRSRDWNEQEAEKMLRAHIQWRLERKVDTILTWYQTPEVIDKYFPGGICGSDKHGRPLFIAPVGYFDPKTFLKAVTRTEFLQSRIYQMEYILKVILPEATAKAGRDIDQLTVIMDMQGLGFKHMSPSWLSIMTESVSMIEANYPEVLGHCFVLNAPPLFSRLYSFIKPLLSKATQEKIEILDSNNLGTLLEYFDAESLPAVYGGSLTDPDGDPRCPSLICWAGPVPESYYASNRQRNGEVTSEDLGLPTSNSAQSLSCLENFTVIEVNRGAIRDIPVGFLSPGVQLHWTVICEAHDIDVGWYFKPLLTRCSSQASIGVPSQSSNPLIRQSSQKQPAVSLSDRPLRELIPIRRIHAGQPSFRGSYQVNIPGSFYMRLDNSYSWMRGKRIRYAIKLNSPKLSPKLSEHRGLYSHHSTEITHHQSNANSLTSIDNLSNDSLVLPLPLDNPSQSRLVTGGSMDVNISLLFRLLAQLLLVPRYPNGATT